MPATEHIALSLDEIVATLCQRVTAVPCETVSWQQAAGRVLAETIVLDRPSPACDVSAMDGYALRAEDFAGGVLQVSQEIAAGVQALPLVPNSAARIFTGAMIPSGADAVIPREQLTEHANHIELPANLVVQPDQHIRRCGENAVAGHVLAEAGQVITGPVLGALASSGKNAVQVRRRVRVSIVVTGNEICTIDQTPKPWQLRDGNGPALLGFLSAIPWLQVAAPVHARDDMQSIKTAIGTGLDQSDALIMTGGVSAGDYDLVPAALKEAGASVMFHKLPIKPGRPVLGAVSASGQPIFALPGNPVAVLVTARRFAIQALRARAGFTRLNQLPPEWVQVAGTIPPPGKLTWFPLVMLNAAGNAEVLPGRGSGDWVSAAASDGFVEVPPGEMPAGVRQLFRWSL